MERRLSFGISTPGGAFGLDEVAQTAAACGAHTDVVLWYEEMSAAVPVTEAQRVHEIGAAPLVTWEPWSWGTASDRSTIAAVIAGDWDDQLISWARGLGGLDHEIHLRFGHEFNGDWYPWSPAGGTSPENYVAAWRHIRRCFGEHGAANVRWMWSPAAGIDSAHPLQAWYPGNDQVDSIGIDGYNWGTTQEWSRWTEPRDVFEATVDEVRGLGGDKTLLISEVGCAEAGGSKPQWIRDFVRWVRDDPDLSGFVWFDHDKEADWRIASTPEAAAAMASALKEVLR